LQLNGQFRESIELVGNHVEFALLILDALQKSVAARCEGSLSLV